MLAANYHDRASAKAALRQIEASLGALPDPADTSAAAVEPVALAHNAIAVSARRLSVATPTGEPVLADLDLDVPAGTHVAILGPSGSGKSTLIEALARLRPHDGQITLGGEPLEEKSEAALRAETVLIGQRTRVCAGTIADSIRLAGPAAKGGAVRAAASRALITDYAHGLPQSPPVCRSLCFALRRATSFRKETTLMLRMARPPGGGKPNTTDCS
jgi:ATP-binding cassette subfamily C protein CydD